MRSRDGTPFSPKRNELPPFATLWTDLEGVMLSETSQSEEDKHAMISLLCGT